MARAQSRRIRCGQWRRLNGGAEQDRILHGHHRVPGVGDDQQLTGGHVGLLLAGHHPHPAAQNLHGRLTLIVVLVQPLAAGQRDHDLTQPVRMSTMDGPRAPATGPGERMTQQTIGQRRQRPLLHDQLAFRWDVPASAGLPALARYAEPGVRQGLQPFQRDAGSG
jgi:hypothetical protein